MEKEILSMSRYCKGDNIPLQVSVCLQPGRGNEGRAELAPRPASVSFTLLPCQLIRISTKEFIFLNRNWREYIDFLN